MKKLLLLVGLVVFYSFSCVADSATDQKVIEEYNKLKNTYPKGYATPCRYQFVTNGGVEWDLHKVYYIVENKNKVFRIWSIDKKGPYFSGWPSILVDQGMADPIVFSNDKVVIWHFEGDTDPIFAYYKKTKDLIIDNEHFANKKKKYSTRIENLKKRIMPDEGDLYDCSRNYQWPFTLK